MTIAPAVPSYASGTSDVPLLGDTIADNFDRVAAAQPDAEAMVEVRTGRRWTYGQLREEIDIVALGLLAAGLTKGDRLGIWAPNLAEWTLVQYATAKLGGILVTINPAYRAHELEYVLNQAGISVLVAVTSVKNSDYPAMISEVRPRCAELRQVILIGTPDWDALVESGRGGDRAELAQLQSQLSPDEPINIQYTSGTTGFPKGATLSHHNIGNNGYLVGKLCGYTPDDRLHPRRPGVHPGALLPLLRHGDGQSRRHHPWRHDGHPRARVRPESDPARRRAGAVHVALRGADDVHRRAQRSGLRVL